MTPLLSLVLLANLAEPAPEFPRVQAIPQPNHAVAFEVDGRMRAVYRFGPDAPRPYIYPLLGPAGRSVVRLGHPHDPHGHRHHLGVWVSHADVNGANFWADGTEARIVHQRVERLEDGADAASITVLNHWRDAAGAVLLEERRTLTLRPLDDASYLDVTIALEAAGGPVTLGQTAFGLLAVRVAKTMSVNDGGGALRDSEGRVGEEAIFRKPARWVDYTGRVLPGAENGVAFFDHPDNPSFPTPFHVRNDGWMGASVSYAAPRVISPGAPLTLRYRLYVHGPEATPATIEEHWRRFSGK